MATVVSPALAALLPPGVAAAVVRYEAATARYDELVARPVEDLSDAELDAIRAAEWAMDEAFNVLADAGQFRLTKPAEIAARYRVASRHCRRLATSGRLDFDELLCVQDEMAMCRCQLAGIGRLDLIEVAA
ncbi:hypothetical protein [Streptomyces sp. NPDC008150]|uniref:hypothetical protein n=1 Tax=Streptomyces sp. NPDC008150 TaxID=3364816 RepID=UPI0036E8DB90